MRRNISRLIVMVLLSGFFTKAASAQQVQPTQQSQFQVPPALALAVLIKTTLIAFNHANRTGNYSVLRDLAAPGFREANSSAKLAEIFNTMRKRTLDLGPIILLQPQLAQQPVIDQQRLLRLQGFFATAPERVNFNLAYQVSGGIWKLFVITVNTTKAPVAGPKAGAFNTTVTRKKPVVKKKK